MAGIIETANNAYEARDRANNEIESLKDQAKREAEDFQNQLRDLAQIAETNRKTRQITSQTNDVKNVMLHSDIDYEKRQKARNHKMLTENTIDP